LSRELDESGKRSSNPVVAMSLQLGKASQRRSLNLQDDGARVWKLDGMETRLAERHAWKERLRRECGKMESLYGVLKVQKVKSTWMDYL